MAIGVFYYVNKKLLQKRLKKYNDFFNLWQKLLNWIVEEQNVDNQEKKTLKSLDIFSELVEKLNTLSKNISNTNEINQLIKELKEVINSYLSLYFNKNYKLHFFNFWYKKSVELLL